MELDNLIIECSKNNRKAQSALFEQYKDTLYFLALKYCRNSVEAEDTLHDAFLTIFQNIKSFRGKGSFEGWMKRIVIYKAIDKYKQKRPIVAQINDQHSEETQIENGLEHYPLEDLLRHIQELPDRYRLVFNLYQMDGYTHKEIAKALGISVSTSKSNYHRAKLQLKQKIEASLHQPELKNTPYGT
ncbi:MAG: RNA polymerase sigma factor [Bacteroidota bacterium]